MRQSNFIAHCHYVIIVVHHGLNICHQASIIHSAVWSGGKLELILSEYTDPQLSHGERPRALKHKSGHFLSFVFFLLGNCSCCAHAKYHWTLHTLSSRLQKTFSCVCGRSESLNFNRSHDIWCRNQFSMEDDVSAAKDIKREPDMELLTCDAEVVS